MKDFADRYGVPWRSGYEFARGVVRDDVRRGAEELGVELWEHIAFVLEAMQAGCAIVSTWPAAS